MSLPAAQIELNRVTFHYPGADLPVVFDLDLAVDQGTFLVIAGPSGSGKSTLLRCLNGLVPHFTGGRFGGAVRVGGQDTRRLGPRAMSRSVGLVFQDPEAQSVASRVEDDIAFGMEQLGVPPVTMRKRVEEVLDLLGIAALRRREISTLSGGERQRVAVAAALALQPDVLALDEPTSQLDPWGAEEVLTALTRLNDDLGLTVVLVEHRLERVISHADRLRYLPIPGSGDVVRDGRPRDVLTEIDLGAVPPLVVLGRKMEWSPLPLTIKQGRDAVRTDPRRPAPPRADALVAGGKPVLALHRISAGHGRSTVLREIDLQVRPGELVALMGRNGSGKTTLLRTILGLHSPTSGRIELAGRDVTALHAAERAATTAYVPQNPTSLFFAETLRDELAFTQKHHPGTKGGVRETLEALGLEHAADRNPRDLSGGERERAALATVLVGRPRVLLLDEPTRGMDYQRKRLLGELAPAALRRGGGDYHGHPRRGISRGGGHEGDPARGWRDRGRWDSTGGAVGIADLRDPDQQALRGWIFDTRRHRLIVRL